MSENIKGLRNKKIVTLNFMSCEYSIYYEYHLRDTYLNMHFKWSRGRLAPPSSHSKLRFILCILGFR